MKHGYVKKIFERLDLQQIRNFLFTGVELREIDERTYIERLEEESQSIEKRLENIFKNKEELDEVFYELGQSEETHAEVFFEMGIKVGARLIFQLLYQN